MPNKFNWGQTVKKPWIAFPLAILAALILAAAIGYIVVDQPFAKKAPTPTFTVPDFGPTDTK